ncbi:MAG: 50S ribosomal protein L3 [Candidatus Marsarchaeota archaeon]|jgi:large subunit ribosomal protein L3|nr:50S ribosomal protein L3 [Candidatus Marsarchaeota archaeon]
MRKGSLEYWPHRRAKKLMPRVRSALQTQEKSMLGFVAFKAGMTHVMMIDDTEGPAKGTEVARAVTVLEVPKVQIYGIRLYSMGYSYKHSAGEIYDSAAAAKVGIKTIKNNDISQFKSKPDKLHDVTLLAFLDPAALGFGNKRVMRFEVPVGGKDSAEKLSFAEGVLGKEVKISEFIKPGDYIDVTSISKGKGWAGVIKRFGVSRQYRKATGKVRHVGTLGAWHPPKVMFGVPHSGHMGYNYRTEINKRVLKVGTNADAAAINIKGGFLGYGLIKNDYILIDGSIPGVAKRLVRIRKAIRNNWAVKQPQLNYVSLESKQ